MLEDLAWLGDRFAVEGDFVAAVPYGSGHINDTYAVSYRRTGVSGAARPQRYIHQRINRKVFKDPVALMDNVARVTRHVRGKLEAAGVEDVDRRVLTLVPARDGGDFVIDDGGEYWRTYLFIEGATTHDVAETPQQVAGVARAFGRFQRQLADLPPPPLAQTIPGFHDTPARLQAFRDAVDADSAGRAAHVREEIGRLEAYAPLADTLLAQVRAGALPLRVAHNDTKINNVLIDEDSGEGLCVIDLDTVMPGLALDDFGDLVRTSVCFAKEDDRDLSKARVEPELFEALARGYLASAATFMTPVEIDHLVLAGELMTYECALRFLADHLRGDTYFRVHHEGHNLDRARVQLALLDSIVTQQDGLRAIVARAAAEVG